MYGLILFTMAFGLVIAAVGVISYLIGRSVEERREEDHVFEDLMDDIEKLGPDSDVADWEDAFDRIMKL